MANIHDLLHCEFFLEPATSLARSHFATCPYSSLIRELGPLSWRHGNGVAGQWSFQTFLPKILTCLLLNNPLLAQDVHTTVLLSGGHSECLLVIIIINHLLVGWVLSHELVARVYYIAIVDLVHVGPTWLHVVIVMVVQSSLSSLMRSVITCALSIELFVVGPVHFIPVLCCLLQVSHPVFQVPLFLNKLLNFNKWIFACELFKNSESLPQILILLLKLEHFCISVI